MQVNDDHFVTWRFIFYSIPVYLGEAHDKYR